MINDAAATKRLKNVKPELWSCGVHERGSVAPGDVDEIRRTVFPTGLSSLNEAESLFAVERAVSNKCREWSELFIELVTDFLVWGERPTGVIVNERAEWAITQVDAGPTTAGLMLLVNLIDEAHLVPSWFSLAVRKRAAQVFEGPATASDAAAPSRKAA
jgi:hypothetical protein